MRSTPSELSMEWPPSTPISEAILPCLADAHDVVGGIRHLESIGIGRDHAVDDIDLFERLADGGAFLGGLGGNVGRPELRADAALPQTRDVGVQPQRFLRPAQVDLAEGEILVSRGIARADRCGRRSAALRGGCAELPR